MSNLKNKFENVKDKVMGKTKEQVGKSSGSEEMELKGMIQTQKAHVVDKFNETKENIARKINNSVDKKEDDYKNK
ncbi:MAG: CsbD family protein [Clostridium sp.]